MTRNAKAVVIEIVCGEPDELRFCRKLSAAANHGPMSLSRVMVTGRQVYPLHEDVYGGAPALMRCEFRIRDVSGVVTVDMVRDLMVRLTGYEIVDAHLADHLGSVMERVGVPVVAAR